MRRVELVPVCAKPPSTNTPAIVGKATAILVIALCIGGESGHSQGGSHASIKAFRGDICRRRCRLLGELCLRAGVYRRLERRQRNRVDTFRRHLRSELHRCVLSNGNGKVKLDLDQNAGTIAYTLTYSNVGTTPPQTGTVSQAHIHFGKSRDSGGILVFFCANIALPPTFNGPTPQSCPPNSGTVSGTWTTADVQAIPGQNVVHGDFNALVDALESDTAYANVHTMPLPGGTNTAYPGGEIRGQVHLAKEEKEHHDQGD